MFGGGINLAADEFFSVAKGLRHKYSGLNGLIPDIFDARGAVGIAKIRMREIDAFVNDADYHTGSVIRLGKVPPVVNFQRMAVEYYLVVEGAELKVVVLDALDEGGAGKVVHLVEGQADSGDVAGSIFKGSAQRFGKGTDGLRVAFYEQGNFPFGITGLRHAFRMQFFQQRSADFRRKGMYRESPANKNHAQRSQLHHRREEWLNKSNTPLHKKWLHLTEIKPISNNEYRVSNNPA